ncbi:MAG TPA: hypothetical protein VKW70_09290 [Terriglobia bacterium]|nr:hypothetical protein [Terriglobia bacterium]
MLPRFQPGVCKACQLPASDLAELTEWRVRHRKLAKGMLRAVGLRKQTWYRHFHRQCKGRFPYWKPEEWQRRREQGRRIAALGWKPGQSGGGNRKGHPDKRPRRKPSGIKAAIIAERQERAERLERTRQAAILEQEERMERAAPLNRALF